ncbi:hypothetical protein B0H14DRAFT_2601032 [Mycena olivaceomarginata]|nr:hypothetical protein B0H14DRAFT_2601032 [Mycena olivaceomarginata]
MDCEEVGAAQRIHRAAPGMRYGGARSVADKGQDLGESQPCMLFRTGDGTGESKGLGLYDGDIAQTKRSAGKGSDYGTKVFCSRWIEWRKLVLHDECIVQHQIFAPICSLRRFRPRAAVLCGAFAAQNLYYEFPRRKLCPVLPPCRSLQSIILASQRGRLRTPRAQALEWESVHDEGAGNHHLGTLALQTVYNCDHREIATDIHKFILRHLLPHNPWTTEHFRSVVAAFGLLQGATCAAELWCRVEYAAGVMIPSSARIRTNAEFHVEEAVQAFCIVNGLKFYCRTEVVLALKWRQDLSSVVKLKFQDNAQGGRGALATGRATQNLSSAADEGTPDEAIHVAAAMQFAGFRSMVGTLWEMADQDGPFVAREFYGMSFAKGQRAPTLLTRRLHCMGRCARCERRTCRASAAGLTRTW